MCKNMGKDDDAGEAGQAICATVEGLATMKDDLRAQKTALNTKRADLLKAYNKVYKATAENLGDMTDIAADAYAEEASMMQEVAKFFQAYNKQYECNWVE